MTSFDPDLILELVDKLQIESDTRINLSPNLGLATTNGPGGRFCFDINMPKVNSSFRSDLQLVN